MEPRFAFAAQFWGDGAVVCRAIEDRPGPVVEQQFGEFKTWTQAQNFAAKLNEGLGLDLLEVRQIVTSSLLASACVVQEALNSTSSWPDGPVVLAARAAQLRFILAELALGVTLCRSAANLPGDTALRALLQAHKVLHHSAQFLKVFDGDYSELKDVASRARTLNTAVEHLSACLPACLDNELAVVF